jgi:hypothetical protein
MTPDFREELTHKWRVKRATARNNSLGVFLREIEYDMRTLPLRPPCRVCGNWPCTCRPES